MQKSGGIRAGFQGLEGGVVPVKIKALTSLRSSDYRWIAGIADHVRLFGQDIFAIFEAAGFVSQCRAHAELLPDHCATTYGVNRDEPFMAFSKVTLPP